MRGLRKRWVGKWQVVYSGKLILIKRRGRVTGRGSAWHCVPMRNKEPERGGGGRKTGIKNRKGRSIAGLDDRKFEAILETRAVVIANLLRPP